MNPLPLAVVAALFVVGMCIITPEIQNNDCIIVGIYPHMPPYQYYKNGELKGFEIDLINELGRRMDKKIIFVETNYKYGNYLAGKSGNVDFSISAITKTTQRENDVVFSDIYMYSYCSLITNDKKYTKLTDFRDKKIGALADSTFEDLAEDYLKSMNFELIRYDNFQSMHSDLLADNLDGAFTDYRYHLNTDDKTGPYLVENLEIHYFGVVSSKDNKDLIDEINMELLNMKADGSLESLNEKYFEFN
ncbi:ABC transporter substrate-binding protein [Methanococcus maripaludis]|uniref:Polar amino acid transport system substrate-binding protein n=2 Tax=Methanococcus maripaludis TaxID=39152 RepID=A0A7J9PGC5_METMI|nr:ABC transporter substrate-binding protein [Methanococcus maripaludis]MBA2861757.1 polar amino acid transport system substrate-binding protein [Methanococcus maripaludis]